MSKNNKILSWLYPYLVCVTVFMVLVLALKLIWGIGSTHLMKSIIDAIVASGFISLLVLPIFVLMRLCSEKLSVIITSIVFAFMFLLEISLTIFTMKSGALMDNEIFLRPINEMIETMQSGVDNLWLILAGFVGFIVLYCYLMSVLVKRLRFNNIISIIATLLIVLSAVFVWMIPNLEASPDPNVRNFVTDKTWYLIRSTVSSEALAQDDVNYDKAMIIEYMRMHPDRYYLNHRYPMEFLDNTKDNLSQFFNDAETKPNIVIVIVESLGNEWMWMSPFVDSLAKESLYWPNCLTTTKRSFGVVPAMTGSVPCGIRGYQFGNMPKTNTLIGILKSNGYQANAFYAGQFYFDCVAEYLFSQKIDYMSDFYKDYKADEDKNKGSYWGYHDEFLFEKSMKVLEKKQSPMLNLFVTISSHDMAKEGNPVFAKATEKAKRIVESQDVHELSDDVFDKAVTFAYADDCLKKFFNDYSKRDDYDNTIFVVTGDHGSGFLMTSDLSRYHVPLIIYSPLLKESRTFKNIVTHNDVVPSLVALMRNKYHFNTPKKVSWAGNYLGINKDDSPSEMLFVEYADGVTKILSDGFFYDKDDDKTYKITDDMMLEEASDDPHHEALKRKLEIYKYVNDYVYLNDMLVSDEILTNEKYEEIYNYHQSDTIECSTAEDGHWVSFYLYPKKKIDGEWEKIKISLKAEVLFIDTLDADQYMDLKFYCSGKNHKYPDYYTDKIVKFLPEDTIEVGKWYDLNVEKEFVVKGATDLKCNINTFYSKWMESNRAMFRNVDVKVSGSNMSTRFEYPSSKIWAHRVNDPEETNAKTEAFDGIEVDLVYDKQNNNIYVSHEKEYGDAMTFREYISKLNHPDEVHYWLDVKNLNEDTETICDTIIAIAYDYGFDGKFVVESWYASAVKQANKKGVYTSLWVDNIAAQDNPDTTAWFDKYSKRIDVGKPDALSADYRMWQLLVEYFPEMKLHLWQTPAEFTKENVRITKKICRDPHVKVLLVDYDKPVNY